MELGIESLLSCSYLCQNEVFITGSNTSLCSLYYNPNIHLNSASQHHQITQLKVETSPVSIQTLFSIVLALVTIFTNQQILLTFDLG